MAEKRKRTPKVVEPTIIEPTIIEEVIDTVPEDYIEPVEQELLYSDMLITCNTCGSVQVIGKGIEGNAVQLTITHDEKSFLQLNCDKCEASLQLRIIKGEAPTIEETPISEETTVNEDVPQENKEEASL